MDENIGLAHNAVYQPILVDIDQAFIWFVKIVLVEQSLFFDEWQNQNRPTGSAWCAAARPIGDAPRGERLVCTFIIEDAEAELPEIILAMTSPCRFAGSLDSGQKEGNEHSNNRDHDQQFYQRKTQEVSTSQTTGPQPSAMSHHA
jgi:hypothetical protein